MIDAGVVVASLPDLLRLVAVPLFGWAAWRDVQTRRVPGRVWWPVVALAVVLLAVDAHGALTGGPDARSLFLVQAGLSLGFVAPLGYLFWRIAGFGGADAKGVMVLALLFPTYPEYLTKAPLQAVGAPGTLPVVETTVPVFAFTVLTNAVVVGALYPLALVGYNGARGDVSSIMFLGRRLRVERLPRVYGRLLERSDGTAGRGLDLDALRMYLQWRDTTLAAIRADPERLRDPDSLPATPNDPGEGIVTDGGRPVEGDAGESDLDPRDTEERADAGSEADTDTGTTTDDDPTDGAHQYDDPWGAEAFLEDLEGSAYGTSPEDLRDGLELLSEAEQVWISPGLPFMVPLFLGIVVGITYGDVLFGVLGAAGVI